MIGEVRSTSRWSSGLKSARLRSSSLTTAQLGRYPYLKPPILRRSEGRSRLNDRISIADSQNSFQNQLLKALVRQRVLKVSNLA